MTAGQRVSEVLRITNTLATVDILPAGKLDRHTSTIRPSVQGKVTPLGERDVLVNGSTLYSLVLDYEFEMLEPGDVFPKWPGLQGVLYESLFHAQLFLLFDSKKKFIGAADAFQSTGIKLGKGKHFCRMQVRHQTISVLESLLDLPMLLERPLSKPINLNFFRTKSDAMIGADKVGGRGLLQGGSLSMYCREPSFDQLPKNINSGDVLSGSLTYIKANKSIIGAGTKPEGFPVKYFYADVKPVNGDKASKEKSGDKKGAGGEEETLEMAVREAKIKYLKSLVGQEASFSATHALLVAEYPDSLPIRLALLSHTVKCKAALLGSKKNEERKDPAVASELLASEVFARVLEAADQVLALIDTGAVAMALGTNAPEQKDAVGSAARKDAETKKTAIIEALTQRCTVLLEIHAFTMTAANEAHHFEGITWTTAGEEPPGKATMENFNAAVSALQKWGDINSDGNWALSVAQSKAQGKFGIALKKVMDILSSPKGKISTHTHTHTHTQQHAREKYPTQNQARNPPLTLFLVSTLFSLSLYPLSFQKEIRGERPFKKKNWNY